MGFPEYKYNPEDYNQSSIHGTDIGKRPYNLTEEIISRISFNDTLVDVGCGLAVKLLPLATHINNIIGIENNPSVFAKAQQNVLESGLTNIRIKLADGNRLPLVSNSVNMVTYMLSPHNAKEAYRVLINGGYVIIDRVGERDKPEIKRFFKDENGLSRGYRSSSSEGEVGKSHLYELFDTGFIEVSCKNMFWQTKYTKDQLWSLLVSTPTIKDFDPGKDKKAFDFAWSELSKLDEVILTQHRVLVIAKV